MRKTLKKITAQAKCACFDIKIQAEINNSSTLSREEILNVKRKLANNLVNSISNLPFAHVYPCEVTVK